jgi:hypothetical protein
VLIVCYVTACVTNVCQTPTSGTESVKAAKKAAQGRSFDGMSARFARCRDADMDDADSQEMKAEISAACSEYGEWLLKSIFFPVGGAVNGFAQSMYCLCNAFVLYTHFSVVLTSGVCGHTRWCRHLCKFVASSECRHVQ